MIRHRQSKENGGRRFKSIQERVFFLIMASVMVCSLVLSVVFCLEANRLLLEREFLLIERSLASTASNINHLLESAQYVYDLISSEGTVQAYLSDRYNSRNERFSAELDVTSLLNSYKMYNSALESVSLVGINGLRSNSQSYSFRKDFGIEDLCLDGETDKRILEWSVFGENQVLVSVKGRYCVSLTGPVRNLANGELLGMLFLDVSEKRLGECINHPFESKTLLLDESGRQLLTVDHEQAMIFQGGTEKESPAAHRYEPEATVGEPQKVEGGYLFTARLNNGWYVADIVPNVFSTSGIVLLLAVVGLSMCGIITAAYYFSKKFSIDITQRLVKMTADMERVESGDFSVVMDTDGSDEITLLAERFNSLLKYINVLINTLYSKQEELAEAELKTLQAQIKPHFLYNTLDTVVWLARFQRTKDIETIVLAMTNYFRLGLNAGEDIIPLSKEIKHVESYLTIQMYRYYQIFTYEVEIEGDLKSRLDILCVPKLTLQPLVENSIYHGIKENQKAGKLVISIRREGEDILIAVSDDGKGMCAEELERLNHIRRTTGGGYGLRNVDNRIRKMFGERYGLSFKSELKKGTTVFLRIPGEVKNQYKRNTQEGDHV